MSEISKQPQIHHVKCWPEYFQAVKSGAKPFEIRLNDRDYQVGDTLILKEFIPYGEFFTGNEIIRTITYITNWVQQEDYVVLGIPDQGEATRLRDRVTLLENYLEELREVTPYRMIKEQVTNVLIESRALRTEDTGKGSPETCAVCLGEPLAWRHSCGADDAIFPIAEDTGIQSVREPVRWFAEQMEETLRLNDPYKSGWQGMSFDDLLQRLEEEVEEVSDLAGEEDVSLKQILRECTDVANFAMMIADNARNAMKGS